MDHLLVVQTAHRLVRAAYVANLEPMVASINRAAETTRLLGSPGTIAPVLRGYRTGARLGLIGTGLPGEPFGDRGFSGAARVDEGVLKSPDFFLDGS